MQKEEAKELLRGVAKDMQGPIGVAIRTLIYDECEACKIQLPVQVKVRYNADIVPLAKIDKSDWVDLRTAEDVELKQGEYRKISLGVSMQLPAGYEALIIPRSSTFEKYGVLQANSVGLIDESYCGNNDIWSFPAYATRDIEIPKNTRICQFRLMKHQEVIEFLIVENLEGKDRGGYGSTGTV